MNSRNASGRIAQDLEPTFRGSGGRGRVASLQQGESPAYLQKTVWLRVGKITLKRCVSKRVWHTGAILHTSAANSLSRALSASVTDPDAILPILQGQGAPVLRLA